MFDGWCTPLVQAKADLADRVDAVARAQASAEQRQGRFEEALGETTSEALRSLHGSVAAAEAAAEARAAELREVLSAEISARQGGSRALSSSVEEIGAAERSSAAQAKARLLIGCLF